MKISKLFVLACAALLVLLAACGSPPVDPTTNRLTVNLAGSGSGSVTITPNGGAAQTVTANTTKTFETGTQVTLSATAAAGSTFDGFSGGGCTGTATCTVTVSTDTTVTATFSDDIIPPPPGSGTVSVELAGTGSGTVTLTPDSGDPANCTAACSETYEEGTVVTVTATADAGSTFDGFSGACTTTPCTITVGDGSADSVTATFTTEGGGGTPGTATVTVTDTNDDAEEYVTGKVGNATYGTPGSISTTTSFIELGFSDRHGSEQLVALRFPNVAIPAGATITDAYITVTAYNDSTGANASGLGNAGELVIDISVQSDANPGSFTDSGSGGTLNQISGRTTTGEVEWTTPALVDWTADTTYDTPDLSSLVQSVVDLGGWSESANALVFVLERDGDDTSGSQSARHFYDWSGGSANAAVLTVEYETEEAP